MLNIIKNKRKMAKHLPKNGPKALLYILFDDYLFLTSCSEIVLWFTKLAKLKKIDSTVLKSQHFIG